MKTDTELLNWLEDQQGQALVSDDCGRWAVSTMGIQNISEEMLKKPCDVSSSYFITADEWRPTAREAIDAAMRAES